MELLFSVENFEQAGKFHELNSPRSLEACLRTGIDPSEIFPKSRKHFKSKGDEPHMVDIKAANFEKKRLEKIGMIQVERTKIIQYAERKMDYTFTTAPGEGGFDGTGGTGGTEKLGVLEIEEKRMQALKRRQEKELQQTIEKEQSRVHIQLKIKRAEDEEIKAQKAHAKKVIEQKKAEEKKRMQLENDEKRLLMEEEHAKKILAKKEAEIEEKIARSRLHMERQVQKEARERDEERKAKMEEYKKKTADLLKTQEDVGEQNKIKMIERERMIMKQLEDKREMKRLEVQASREKAAIRIEEALHKHHELHEHKRIAFDDRQRKGLQLAKEKAVLDRERFKKQADDREKRQAVRHHRLVDAFKTREERREEIVQRRHEKDSVFNTISEKRDGEISMLKFTTALKLSDKAENVERVSRINEFKRLQTQQRINAMDQKYEEIQYMKQDLATRQAEASKNSLIRKHEISDAMDKMRETNDYSILDKLFAKKKPETKKLDDDEKEDPRLAQTI